jgi:hypothetical protein
MMKMGNAQSFVRNTLHWNVLAHVLMVVMQCIKPANCDNYVTMQIRQVVTGAYQGIPKGPQPMTLDDLLVSEPLCGNNIIAEELTKKPAHGQASVLWHPTAGHADWLLDSAWQVSTTAWSQRKTVVSSDVLVFLIRCSVRKQLISCPGSVVLHFTLSIKCLNSRTTTPVLGLPQSQFRALAYLLHINENVFCVQSPLFACHRISQQGKAELLLQ